MTSPDYYQTLAENALAEAEGGGFWAAKDTKLLARALLACNQERQEAQDTLAACQAAAAVLAAGSQDQRARADTAEQALRKILRHAGDKRDWYVVIARDALTEDTP